MPQRSLTRDRGELAAFLKDRRAALGPADVGLAPSGRRRTPGLRREKWPPSFASGSPGTPGSSRAAA